MARGRNKVPETGSAFGRGPHQKRPRQNATNAIKPKRKRKKINEPDRYPVAHDGLVAGSSPAGPTTLRPDGLRVAQPCGAGQGEACPA